MSVSPDQRIAELEARVRQLSDVVACIPMAAAGLGLIPLDQYAEAMQSPIEAMKVLEEISGTAEKWLSFAEGRGGMCDSEAAVLAGFVDRRRRRLEREIATVRR